MLQQCRLVILATLVVAAFVRSAAPDVARQAAPASTVIAFTGVRIFDGTSRPTLERGVLLVRAGRIEAVGPEDRVQVPAGARRVDLAGRTVVPGLINAHGHVGDTRDLKSDASFYTRENILAQLGVYGRYGLTSVFSLGGDGEPGFQVRAEQTTPTLARARLYVGGPVVTDQDPSKARATVDVIAGLKPDVIKIRVDDNLGTGTKMPEAAYRAVIDQAHKHGLRVAAHIFYRADAKKLLDAGVDFIAHSVRDQEVDAELVKLMKARDVCYCPTLMREVSTFVYESTPAFFDDPFFRREVDAGVIDQLKDPVRQQGVRASKSVQAYKAALEVASRNLKKLADQGVRIAMGTDTGPPGRFQGYFEHLELERMVQAGLTTQQALISATGDAARCMNVAEIGTLERGKWADFIVLARNPLDDIRHTRTIESVWVAGNQLQSTSN